MKAKTLKKDFLEGVFYILKKHKGPATEMHMSLLRADLNGHLKKAHRMGEIAGIPRFRFAWDDRDPNRLMVDFEKEDCEKYGLFESENEKTH